MNNPGRRSKTNRQSPHPVSTDPNWAKSTFNHGKYEALRLPLVAQWLGLTMLAFAYPVIFSATQKNLYFDDPYILMRYGENLAHGTGWSFNPNSPTDNAVTSPFYVLLIAAGTFIGGSAEAWSMWIYAVAWGLGGIILGRIFFLDGRRVAGWLACVLYSISPLLAHSRGMETSLYLLLIVTAIWTFQRERWLVLGSLLGLLALTRSDGGLLAVALIGWLGLRRSRATVLAVLGPFAAIGASSAAILWGFTGSLAPSTLAAKLAQRDSGSWGKPLTNLLYGLSSSGTMGIEVVSPPVTAAGIFVLIASLLLPIAPLFATVVAFRRGEHVLPMLAVAAAIVVVEYGVIFRLPEGYVWHYGPWTLWVIAGLAVALDEATRRNHRVWAACSAAVALLVLISASHVNWSTTWSSTRSNYRRVAEWIDRDAPSPHPTVAASEFGAIGYYSRADMVDYLGLLDSRAIDSVRRNDFTWWLSTKPDYWVTPKGWLVDAATLALPEFKQNYVPVTTIGPLTVYRRITL